jgi:glutathione S-transferase
VLEDGTLLNENVAVLLYLADRKPEAKLAPPAGTPERYALINALAFVATEIHPAMGVLFATSPSPEVRACCCATNALRIVAVASLIVASPHAARADHGLPEEARERQGGQAGAHA